MREMKSLPLCIYNPSYKYLKDSFYASCAPHGTGNSKIINENPCLQRTHHLVVET